MSNEAVHIVDAPKVQVVDRISNMHTGIYFKLFQELHNLCTLTSDEAMHIVNAPKAQVVDRISNMHTGIYFKLFQELHDYVH